MPAAAALVPKTQRSAESMKKNFFFENLSIANKTPFFARSFLDAHLFRFLFCTKAAPFYKAKNVTADIFLHKRKNIRDILHIILYMQQNMQKLLCKMQRKACCKQLFLTNDTNCINFVNLNK